MKTTAKRGILALAASGLLAVTAFAGLTTMPATAGQSDTCDAALVTLTKTSTADGALLPNAVYVVQADPNTYLMVGDQTGQEDAFNAAFNSQFGALEDTAAGQAIIAAYQTSLGEDMPNYPADITAITNASVQVTALAQWQADGNGEVAAFLADAERRADALQAALDANPDLEAQDAAYFELLTGELAGLTTVVDNVNTALTTTDWDTFVTAYNTFTDTDNWSYGLATHPSLQYVDFLNGVTEEDYNAANAYAAEQVGATSEITVTTDENGVATFTIFGVKYINGDVNTRGDLTCSQLSGDVTEAQAPGGYQLDPAPYDFISDDTATASLDLTNTPVDYVSPDVPVWTDTGL